MKPRPQTIQIFLPQGDPSGIRQAEITTRTVRVFEIPRSQVSEFLKMPESSQVGLYFLFGAADDENYEAYIGQSGNVGRRLAQHVGGKEFWERALIAVSLTNTWTDTHVGFMEWKAIESANVSGRYSLLNGNSASNRHTPLPLESDCHEYLETISILLATLGRPVLEPLKRLHSGGDSYEEPVEPAETADLRLDSADEQRLFLRQRGCTAEGLQSAEGLIVIAGSSGNALDRPGIRPGIKRIRDRILAQGVASISGENLVFNRDHLFSSPSNAASALVGGAQNGRTAWKTAEGRTLKDLEEQQFGRGQSTGDS